MAVPVLDDGGIPTPDQLRIASRPHLSERRLILLVGDLLVASVALALATLPRGWWAVPGNSPVAIWFAVLLALDGLISRASDSHDLRTSANPFAGSYAGARGWLVTVLLYLTIPYASAPLLSSRAAVAVFFLSGLVLRVVWRAGYALLIRQPRWTTRYALLGTGPSAATMVRAIQEQLGPEHEVLGCIAEDGTDLDAPDKDGEAVRVLGGPEELDALLGEGRVSTLILATSKVMPAALYRQVIRAYEAGVRVLPMPVFYEAVTGRVPVEHVGDYWYVALPKMEQDWLYRITKRVMDLVGAVAGLVGTLALTPFIALAVAVSGRGPVLYKQTRLGLRGKPFAVWKFRTMVHGAEAEGEAVWAQPGDPRVTGVGRFLRATRLDELPQFWNVLKGEMSLVGPRPERPELVARLQDDVPFYRVRLLARPGITGWAQVKQPYARSVEETLLKLQYDLYYIGHQSPYLDLLILLKTVGVVLRFSGS